MIDIELKRMIVLIAMSHFRESYIGQIRVLIFKKTGLSFGHENVRRYVKSLNGYVEKTGNKGPRGVDLFSLTKKGKEILESDTAKFLYFGWGSLFLDQEG